MKSIYIIVWRIDVSKTTQWARKIATKSTVPISYIFLTVALMNIRVN